MMQQLATQGSQIAALPEKAVSRDATQSVESVLPVSPGQNTSVKSDSFAHVFNRHRSNEQNSEASSTASKNKLAERVAESDRLQKSEKATQDVKDNPSQEMSQKVVASREDKPISKNADESDVESAEEYFQGEAEKHKAIAAGSSDSIMTEGEPDYLAMIDAIRTLEENWRSPGDTSAVKGEDDIITIAPVEVGGSLDSNLLDRMQEWMDAIIPGELPEDIQATPLQQLHGAEQVLSDLLALVNQLNAGSEGDSAENTDTALLVDTELAETLSSQTITESDALTEENLLSLAVRLLEGMPGQRMGNNAEEQTSVESVDADLLAELNPENIMLAEEPLEVAEMADESLLNQAKLLVSLMRQTQQTAGTDNAGANSVTPATASTVTDTDALESLLGQATDQTLSELVDVMTDSAGKANPSLTDTQLSQIRSQLSMGLEEMRSQLKQGHEPGIDLAALVKQTMQDVAPESPQSMAYPVLQDVQQLTQLASVAAMSAGQEQQLTELVAVARDVLVNETRQQHGDTLKSLQQQAIFDKPVNVLQPQGQEQIAEKIRWMVNGRQAMAEIRLDPPEMGSMQIRLNVSGDSASVSFVVQSQHAKEALADAMPRLRDMFAEQGLDLGESFVSQENNGEASDGESTGQQGSTFAQEGLDDTNSQETPVVRAANGLIDDYV